MNIADIISGFRVDDFVYNEQGSLGPRVQTSLQLFYVYSGHASVSVDGMVRLVGPGEITLLLPDHVELFRFAQNEKTHHGYCSALDVELSEKQQVDYQKLTTVFPMSGKIHELTDWAKTLGARTDRPALNLYDQIAYLLFYEFFNIAGYPEQLAPLPESVLRAKRLIDEKFGSPLDLTQMARAACITPTHLIRLFKVHLKTTPVNYLWDVRTEHGTRLLVDTGLNVAEISYRCGFSAPYHFARRFKARYGMAPGAYRRRQWMR
ncbi:MAG: AraC family transcriptional regulator [Kiritimatiellales bacterium]|nr:AraC family transcriptional regulator [Kiritimatiellales bacterium]MCF7863252.1 AraC family transcriptional regulator [Kiritimatiellales bacterium]